MLAKYTSAEEVVWVQEEPRNQGAYSHVRDRVDDVLENINWEGKPLRYVGRRESAIPAPGVGKLYQAQQKTVIDSALEEM